MDKTDFRKHILQNTEPFLPSLASKMMSLSVEIRCQLEITHWL